jgi:CRP-like cAMP-binding protein
VGSCCFADRLGEWIALTGAERTALARLEERERRLRRSAVLLRENDRLGDLYVLKQGMMMSYVLLDDGSRQILRFMFPGDLLSVSSLVYRQAPETIAALSDCVVSPFDRGQLADIVAMHPRLAALLLAITQMERVICTDRLAAIGRTSAKARVAALLLELRDRMRNGCTPNEASFAPGVTQEEIGDATGLTAVHVNRMLRQLEEEHLIARDNGRFTLLDETKLKRAASYVDRFAGVDLGWLPAATE